MIIKRIKPMICLWLMAIVMAGCQPALQMESAPTLAVVGTDTPAPTHSEAVKVPFTATPEPSATPLPVPSMTATFVTAPFLSLPAGQYLVLSASSYSGVDDVYAVLPETGEVYSLGKLPMGFLISPASNWVEAYNDEGYFAYNYANGQSLRPGDALGSCINLTGPADMQKIAMICERGNLFIWHRLTGKVRQLTNFDTATELLERLAWSPDGKWLAYTLRNSDYPLRDDPIDGLYLIETACILQNTSCEQATSGPFAADKIMYYKRFIWSPDSQKILVERLQRDEDDRPEFKVFNIATKSFGNLDFTTWYYVDSMVWSADGQWLAFTGGDEESGNDGLFIVPATGGKPERITLPEKFKNFSLQFWIKVP
jgi:hypothetical protein